ncbi:hypothetical protein SCP_0400390 [Sparassis crispa]|uniref:Uncharacterized protein n=1 Tax=Sparassis crispa TaxID=139825 RepID=A0A401GHN9_9APHY|nr:hypothetical protein SCP_0400390 [Sparassis crispa]GBE81668.1 hypothetical protein SCP_0400390 [Sparassis crispa]
MRLFAAPSSLRKGLGNELQWEKDVGDGAQCDTASIAGVAAQPLSSNEHLQGGSAFNNSLPATPL